MTGVPSLTQVLAHHARSDATMLIHEEVAISFARVFEESQRLAAALRSFGIQPGDRVAIWMPAHPAWWVSLFACARLGAIVLAVNTRYVTRELSDILQRSGASALVCWPGFSRVDFAGILDGCRPEDLPRLKHVITYGQHDDVARPLSAAWNCVPYDSALSSPPMTEDVEAADSPCIIWTTSGTTKAPKFVLHNQASLVGHAKDVVAAHGFGPDSVLMLAPPICGAFGSCLAIAMCVAGRPVITGPVWDPELAARWIRRYKATHMHGVDDAIAQILEHSDASPAFPTLQYCGFGAFNPARRDIVATADRRGLTIVGMYGTSEIQGLFARQSEQAAASDRAEGGGRPVSPRVKVRVRDPHSGQLQPTGEQGELEVYAPTSRMIGYFEDADATAAAFTEDGFYRTGDLGYLHADGRLTFLGRIGDTMRLGGFLVSPREIESVVESITGSTCQVIDVVLDGVPRAYAFVAKGGRPLDVERAMQHCRSSLARYKVPCRIVEIDAFPVADGTNGAKVQKSRLREIAARSIQQRETVR